MMLCSILPPRPEEQKWAFSVLPPPRFEVEARYRYLKEKTQIRKIGILHDPTPYALLTKDLGVKLAKDFGLEVVAVETYKPDDADLSVQIGRINARRRRRHHQDGAGRLDRDHGAKNIKQLGLDKMLLLGRASTTARSSAGAARCWASASSSWRPPCRCPSADRLPARPRDADRYLPEGCGSEKYRRPRSRRAGARAWDSMMVIAKGVEIAKSTDGAAIRDAIEKAAGLSGRLRGLQLLARAACRHHREPVRASARAKAASWRCEVRAAREPSRARRSSTCASISAIYGRVHALKPTSLHVAEGELVTVLGPNGAGKTTLLARHHAAHARARARSCSRARTSAELPTHALARARHHHGAGGAGPVRPDVGAREPHSRRLHARGAGASSSDGSTRVFAPVPAAEGALRPGRRRRSPAASSRCSRSAAR